jgi:SNF2 family DNA or RNA helicase
MTDLDLTLSTPTTLGIDLSWPLAIETLPGLDRPMTVNIRATPLLAKAPWVRTLGKLPLEVATQGWRFPLPVSVSPCLPVPRRQADTEKGKQGHKERTRLQPPRDMLLFKDRLMYLLQPALEDICAGKQVHLPFQPSPYQVKGIAFLMPRHAALLADEMGLGKTAQVLIALRLLFHSGLIRRVLVVCPKPLVINWTRELKIWAEDIPFEVIGGDTRTRRAQWFASKCPLKLVNYELLTRDAGFVTPPASPSETGQGADERLHFDVVVLDEAQRIKNRDSKTAQVVHAIPRDRSWAMTGTPIENRIEDLINIFAFVDPDRVPADTPAKLLPELTQDSILRRVKEEVATDMPPKVIHDTYLELTPAQRASYSVAEKEGIVHLNEMGDTVTVQHVFELVMRLKQICNFDPATGESAKLEQLQADVAEVADSGRKAIVFSQWVGPLEKIAAVLAPFGPLLFHGQVPHRQRQPILDQFKRDAHNHVLLMSYGTGSVGLNLQFANYVFLFDRWWNPAVEDQAINRAHRLGQKETVFVTRFISQGTIEGRIADILEKKRQLFRDMIGQNGLPTSMGLTEDDIFGLFDVKARPRRGADNRLAA